MELNFIRDLLNMTLKGATESIWTSGYKEAGGLMWKWGNGDLILSSSWVNIQEAGADGTQKGENLKTMQTQTGGDMMPYWGKSQLSVVDGIQHMGAEVFDSTPATMLDAYMLHAYMYNIMLDAYMLHV